MKEKSDIKALLLTPPLTVRQRMGALAEGGAVMPALGVLYIAAFMRKEGLNVEVLDAEGLGLDLEATVCAILKHRPDVLGITATTLSIGSAGSVAHRIKSRVPDIKIIAGGPHVTAMPRETMERLPDIDGCILGDGELSFTKVVRNIQAGIDMGQDGDGVVWRQGDDVLTNPKKSHLQDLDILPLPAWDLLKDFARIYRPPFHSYRRLPAANIVTSRGCPFSCSFCDRSVFGRKVYTHSVEYVIEMIEHLVQNFHIREISIKDDTFVLFPERVFEFCRCMRLRGLDMVWSCNARVDMITGEMLKEMKNAGCWMISYGIESGSAEMLKKVAKGITKSQIINALRLTRKNGMVSKGFFMIGAPGETEETIQETVEFIKQLELDELNVNFFTPFPGSELFDEIVREGFEVDFSRMNMLEPVYVAQGLTEDMLYKYQKEIIYSFYPRMSKMLAVGLRSMRNADEFKRLLRMLRMFLAVSRRTSSQGLHRKAV